MERYKIREKAENGRLTEQQIEAIEILYRHGVPQIDVASWFSVSTTTISVMWLKFKARGIEQDKVTSIIELLREHGIELGSYDTNTKTYEIQHKPNRLRLTYQQETAARIMYRNGMNQAALVRFFGLNPTFASNLFKKFSAEFGEVEKSTIPDILKREGFELETPKTK